MMANIILIIRALKISYFQSRSSIESKTFLKSKKKSRKFLLSTLIWKMFIFHTDITTLRLKGIIFYIPLYHSFEMYGSQQYFELENMPTFIALYCIKHTYYAENYFHFVRISSQEKGMWCTLKQNTSFSALVSKYTSNF